MYIAIAHCHTCHNKHSCIVCIWQNIYCGSSFVYNRGVRRRQRVSATDRSFVSAQPPLRILSPLGQDFNIQNRILKLCLHFVSFDFNIHNELTPLPHFHNWIFNHHPLVKILIFIIEYFSWPGYKELSWEFIIEHSINSQLTCWPTFDFKWNDHLSPFTQDINLKI